MAATAHSDPYAVFMRKIGYSVGLEFTAERVDGLVARYLQDRDLTVGGWHELVTGRREDGNWGRDESAKRHIADFFHSLRLIQRTAGDVLVLENLDAMAIATSMLNNKADQDAAARPSPGVEHSCKRRRDLREPTLGRISGAADQGYAACNDASKARRPAETHGRQGFLQTHQPGNYDRASGKEQGERRRESIRVLAQAHRAIAGRTRTGTHGE